MHVLVISSRSACLEGAEHLARRRGLEGSWVWTSGTRRGARQLEREAFDAVVVDARDPQRGSVALLERLRAECPRTIRVAVASDAAHAASTWRYRAAHRCVEPSAAHVVDAIERSHALRQRICTPPVAELLQRAKWPPRAHLPAFGALMRHGGGRRGADWVSDAMAMSPEVTETLGRRLRVVDACGEGRRSFDDAVARWGVVRAVAAAMAVEVYAAIEHQLGPSASWVARERREAWLVAETAAGLASRGVVAEQAYAAGLCLDLGRLLMAAHAPDAAETVATSGLQGHELCAFERDLLGFDHAALGAAMLDCLDVPHAVVEAVAEHHDPGWDGEGQVPLAPPGTASFACHVAAGLVADAAGRGAEELEGSVHLMSLEPSFLAQQRARAREAFLEEVA